MKTTKIFLKTAIITIVLGSLCVLPTLALDSEKSFSVVTLSNTNTGQDAYDIYVDLSNQLCFVSCGYEGVKIFNISNLEGPNLLSSIPEVNGYAHQFDVVNNNILFIGDGSGGLKIINCSEPSNPEVIVQYTGDYSWVVNVDEQNEIAYVSNGGFGLDPRLTILNITNLSIPSIIGNVSLLDNGADLEIIDNYAYVAESTTGFEIIDISNISQPVSLSNYPIETDYAIDIEIRDNLVYLSKWGSKGHIINVSDPLNPIQVGEIPQIKNCFALKIYDDILYASDHDEGLIFLDISNKTAPNELFRYNEGGKPCKISIHNNTIFIADQVNGLVIIQLEEEISTIHSYNSWIIVSSFGILTIYFLFKKKLYKKRK
jgi:hypothetical protein